METRKFEKGATVRLKSGGPLMTVVGHQQYFDGGDSPVTSCSWFVDGELKNAKFHEDALEAESKD